MVKYGMDPFVCPIIDWFPTFPYKSQADWYPKWFNLWCPADIVSKKMSWSIYVAPYNPVFVANNYMQDTHMPKPAFTHVCVCVCVCVWVGMGRSQKRSKTCMYIYIILYKRCKTSICRADQWQMHLSNYGAFTSGFPEVLRRSFDGNNCKSFCRSSQTYTTENLSPSKTARARQQGLSNFHIQ